MPNEMSAHLYKDGHVTHDWQQTQFLQKAFRTEDALREEVERYGQVRPKRNRMLDWNDGESARSSGRSNMISSRKFQSPSARQSARSSARGSCSTCSCGCSHTGRYSTARSGMSSRRSGSCRSSIISSECSSFCSCDCHSDSGWSDAISTGRSSALFTGRTDSTRRVDSLLARKRRLEAQLEALEEELQENEVLSSSTAPSARSLRSTGSKTTGSKTSSVSSNKNPN